MIKKIMKILYPFLLLIFFCSSCTRTGLDSLIVFFISGGQVYSVDYDGQNIKRLTNDLNSYHSVSSSMDGESLLLSADNGNMYLLNYSGGESVYFTDGKYGTYGPSGDVYYIRKGGSFYNIIARCDSNGDNITHIKVMAADVDIYSISCSPDEKKLAIYYWQSGPSYSASMSLVTLSDPQTITNTGLYPAYSPLNNDLLSIIAVDYLRITYQDSTFIDLYTSAYGTISSRPAWSPDGEYIFFAYNPADPALKEIMRIKADGSEIMTVNTFSTAITAFCVHGKPR